MTLLTDMQAMLAASGPTWSEGRPAAAKPSMRAANDDDWTKDKEAPPITEAAHLHAPSLEALKAAMVHIDDDVIERYGDFEKYLRALAGASGGCTDFLKEVVVPWAAGDKRKRNTPALIRQKWRSHKTSFVGWDHVQKIAAKAKAEALAAQAVPVTASPFVWREPASIEPRRWLYGWHYIRRYLSCTIAPGGVGKSSLELVEAVAMAAGKSLLGDRPAGKLRVWYVNGEDPLEEIERRIAAICLQHGITREDLGGWLFINSGRDNEILLAQDSREGVQVATARITELRRAIIENRIDVVILDPFVAFHAVSENDNRAINAVCRQLAMLAEEANCAIEVVHHTRKAGPKQTEHAAEDARGASALLAAVRSARILNRMKGEDAERAGVRDPWAYFRVDSGKANLAPAGDATWRRLVDRTLDNGREGVPGDRVGVVVAWQWPDRAGALTDGDMRAVQDVIAGGQCRSNVQAGDWAGYGVAEALDFDASEKAGRARAKEILAALTADGWLKVVQAPDKNGDQRPFVRVGKVKELRRSQLMDDETGLEDAFEW
jgi:hypothetical protein